MQNKIFKFMTAANSVRSVADYTVRAFIIILFMSVFMTPALVHAASVLFNPDAHTARDTQGFTTTLIINTQGENINSVEGVLKIDSRLISPELRISDSGSIITYWINRPAAPDKGTTEIKFSGAIPGGYTGANGILFSLVFPSYTGPSVDQAITISSLNAYKNDGLATKVEITGKPFSVGEVAGQSDPEVAEELYLTDNRKDDISPEPFSPQIAKQDDVFGGQWFINFSTVDKQSGVDHYEIQESRSGSLDSGKWKEVSSPYLLEDQDLHSYVYVIATDRQGNERIIKVFPRNPLPWQNKYGWVFVIIIILVCASIWFYRRQRMDK